MSPARDLATMYIYIYISYYILFVSSKVIPYTHCPKERSSISHHRNPCSLFHWQVRRNTWCFMIPFLFQKKLRRWFELIFPGMFLR